MQRYKTIDSWVVNSNDVSIEDTANTSSLDTYQQEELDFVYSRLSNFRVAIDIGAHIGLVSNQLSQRFNNVESFELNPSICKCLKINMTQKGCNNVTIHNCGLGQEKKLVSLKYKSKDTTDKRSFGVHVNEKSGNILITSLDSFNFIDVDFIKIDTEGYEPLVLLGALQTIKNFKPIIMLENKGHSRRYGYDENFILEILKPFGYEIIHKFTKDWVISV